MLNWKGRDYKTIFDVLLVDKRLFKLLDNIEPEIRCINVCDVLNNISFYIIVLTKHKT